jgi:hypothetical protein
LDVLAFLGRLDKQSAAMADEAGMSALPVRARMLELAGHIGHKPHPVVRSWWATARVLSSHDAPAFVPDVPCPIETCDQRGSLRVRVEEMPQDRVAVCVECRTVWAGAGEFGLLARWVEWAAEHLHGIRHWVNTTSAHGYDEGLGYVVECPECAPWRLGMADREARRLLAPRSYNPVLSDAVAR